MTYSSLWITGRKPVSIWWKLNPIWWLGNTNEPWPPSWYLPQRPFWWRTLFWYCRNPIQNFLDFIVGVVDRNYEVVGPIPVTVTDWHDIGQKGWKWCLIKTRIPLPYISYSGERVLYNSTCVRSDV
jgi:hypothetical protein